MTPPARPAPYADLSPDRVLDAIAAVGLQPDGRLLQLNSYENRVFQVMLDDGDAVVAKFYRPQRWSDAQIVEEHAFALELEAAEVPVVAPRVLRSADDAVTLLPRGGPTTLGVHHAASGSFRFSVSPRRAGRTPELDDAAVLHRLGGFIGRLHAVGARRAFDVRRRLDARRDVREALALIEREGFVPHEQRAAWGEAGEAAVAVIDAAFESAAPRAIRLHGDCHAGNLLWRDAGAHVVDLDDACMGPAVQDLWMLLSGDAFAMARQLRALLDGYSTFMPFERSELRLVEPLRLLRMVRHNAWVAQRWLDPAFPAAYPDFGTSAYWGQQAMQLREQWQVAREVPTLDTLV
jgi:Ser/Thr protein kinase RdoA (MazF antagonist)